MKEFLEAIEQNEELKAKVTVLDKKADAKPEDYIALAKEYGFELSEEDFLPVNNELYEEELNAVAGGKECVCVVGGGGTKEDFPAYMNFDSKTCACVFGGAGSFVRNDGSTGTRCCCPVGGYGGDEPFH